MAIPESPFKTTRKVCDGAETYQTTKLKELGLQEGAQRGLRWGGNERKLRRARGGGHFNIGGIPGSP